MQDLAERYGMTPSGMLIVIALAVAIVGVVFLVPSRRGGHATVRVPENFSQKAQEVQTAKEAADSVNSQVGNPAAPQPAEQPQAPAAKPASHTGTAGASVVSASSADLALIADRVGRLDPFAPILDATIPEPQQAEQVVEEIPADDFNPIIENFSIPFPQVPNPIYVKPPSFSLTAISAKTGTGEHFVIINNEILKRGDFVPGTQYYVADIDARSMNKVTLRSTDAAAEPLDVFIKRRYGDVNAELSVDGTRSFSNIDSSPAPEDELLLPGQPVYEWKQPEARPGALPVPNYTAPSGASKTAPHK